MSDQTRVFGFHDLERAALGFVLEDETWPVFLIWFALRHATPEAHRWLAAGPDLDQIREEFLQHGPKKPTET